MYLLLNYKVINPLILYSIFDHKVITVIIINMTLNYKVINSLILYPIFDHKVITLIINYITYMLNYKVINLKLMYLVIYVESPSGQLNHFVQNFCCWLFKHISSWVKNHLNPLYG